MQDDSRIKTAGAEMALLEEAVRAAAKVAMGFFGKDPKSWKKDKDNSPVSEADLATDEVLRRLLTAARPGFGWISEESAHKPPAEGEDRMWIVDPIDGTRGFLGGRPEWAVSAALVQGRRPLAGIVFNPAADRLYAATTGGGAFLNGRPIKAPPGGSLTGARMLAYDGALRDGRWSRPWPEMQIERVNSIAYRLCLVASGDFDASISTSPKSDWDLAAADLIVHEAGGRVTAFNGASFVYNRHAFRHPNVVCAGTVLHERLLAHIDAAFDALRGGAEDGLD
ncbi:MAG TPA: 3'(2'),5'-bisphosphate nucleotidase CysQ [Hyphomicrobiales bacterium]|nr:3'(2'),5'-bisphosphate nucleotidase CysQ [Rhodobiaceae bacterium]HXK54026.1 3'(2'),5'-bisphosphate nucleotidase CysQ [Hyphomicrobiales bacterium]